MYLLSGTFNAQDGDDVHQLYWAGSEEFFTIMVLVGTTSRPLLVRRLRMALHEWLRNPGREVMSTDVDRPPIV